MTVQGKCTATKQKSFIYAESKAQKFLVGCSRACSQGLICDIAGLQALLQLGDCFSNPLARTAHQPLAAID
jgi:hypothetical protein